MAESCSVSQKPALPCEADSSVMAELDCLISLALASHNLDEPKCRPQFVESEQAFIDFEELRHPSMCLRSDFIPNDVKLGGEDDGTPRTVLLTGPNMAGKSTLLRMTAAGIIMAQIGCFVPAAKARLSPIDKIQTRMGAYDSEWPNDSGGAWTDGRHVRQRKYVQGGAGRVQQDTPRSGSQVICHP
jgi:DNA mismatch repair protein MSH6